MRLSLGSIAHTRSGDKGDTSNIGVIALKPEYYSIILRDTFIDALDREIDRLCLEFIIRQQPVGMHLRFAAAAIKINLELERVGDYAKSIAKQGLKLSRHLHDSLLALPGRG